MELFQRSKKIYIRWKFVKGGRRIVFFLVRIFFSSENNFFRELGSGGWQPSNGLHPSILHQRNVKHILKEYEKIYSQKCEKHGISL